MLNGDMQNHIRVGVCLVNKSFHVGIDSLIFIPRSRVNQTVHTRATKSQIIMT